MATITVTTTPQPNNVPPRVKIDIVDSGAPAINSVTVTCTDVTGNVETVRTSDGNPLTLVTSGTTRVGTIYHYEMDLGSPVTYSTVEKPLVTSTTQVDSSLVWLVHPGIPALSMPINVASFDTKVRRTVQGVFYPLGRKNPIVVTDGSRKGVTSSLQVRTSSLVELSTLEALTADAGVLLLNVPAQFNWGLSSSYIAIGDMEEARLVDYAGDQNRYVTLPYVVVDSPIGGNQAQYTWADVIAKYPTWSALIAANPTWADVIAPTT
jgi:hypothetical protein